MSNGDPKTTRELYFWLKGEMADMRTHITDSVSDAIETHARDCSVKYNLAEHKRIHWKWVIIVCAIPPAIVAGIEILKRLI